MTEMYTLAEARRLIGKEACLNQGYHVFEEARTRAGQTIKVWCSTCMTEFREVTDEVSPVGGDET